MTFYETETETETEKELDMTQENAVDKAVREAKENAEKNAAANPQTTAVATTAPAGAPAAYQPPRKFTADDMTAGTMNVDAFLKVNEDGLKIGDKPGLIESIVVSIDMGAVLYCQAIKFGNPAIYYKTYNNADASTGGSWADAVAKAKLADPKANPYSSADITMVLLEDAKSIKGEVMLEAGKKVGNSLSTTNKANFAELLSAIEKAGLNKHASDVKVKVTAEPRTNKNANKWGVLKFELLGEMGADEAGDTPASTETAAA